MKTFTNALEGKVGALFTEMRQAPELTGYIVTGIPVALACYLRKQMIDDTKPEVKCKIGNLMELVLKVGKRGDSVALTPDFALLEKGKELIKEDKLNVSVEDMESLSLDILENEELLVALREGVAGKIYNDSEWIDATEEKQKGLVFDEQSDVAVVAAAELLTILEVLCNNKDASAEVSYEVPGFGTFTVKETKGDWDVTLSYDKSFKANIKSDAVVAAISALEF